jgi:hypothetical protein
MSLGSSVIEADRRQETDVVDRRQADFDRTLEALAKLARTAPRPVYQRNERPARRPRTLQRALILAVIAGAAILGWRHFRSPHSSAAASPSVAQVIVAETPPAATSGLGASLPPAQAVQATIDPPAPTTPSPDRQQLDAMARELAALRQTVEQLEATARDLTDLRQAVAQLAASQDQVARDLARLAAAGPETSRNTPTSAPRATVVSAHKPAPVPAPQSSSDGSSDLLKRVLAPFQSR